MALVYENDAVVGPATHVMVVGVGDYPHLIGGSSDIRAAKPAGMRQLTSPPVSAAAFADWAIGRFDNPARPLASVELLLGSAPTEYTPPERGGIASPAKASGVATLAEMKAAAVRWKARGNLHPDNLLIFYFCGHGLSKGNEYLIVASDYGGDMAEPMRGLIDIKRFLIGMKDCRARHQCYFIDACRASDESLIDVDDYSDSLVQKLASPVAGLAQCVYYATLGGETAQAIPNEPSFYTRALIQSLNGVGANNSNGGQWYVNTSRLFEALGHLMARISDPRLRERVLTPLSESQVPFDIHLVGELPDLPIHVSIDTYRGEEPPPVVDALTFCQHTVDVARHPAGTPPLARSCDWQHRYFETWLKSGATTIMLDKQGAARRTEDFYLQPPGFTLEEW